MKSAKVLFVGGEKGGLDAAKFGFKDGRLPPYRAFSARTPAEAKKLLHAEEFDAVVAGYAPGDKAVNAALALVKDIPLIIVCDGDAAGGAQKELKNISQFLIRDKGGAYARQLVPLLDAVISCRRRGEENRILAQVVAGISDIVYVTDTEDGIIFVNKAFQNAFGYTEQEALKLKASSLWKETPQAAAPVQGPSLAERELYAVRKDGTSFPASFSRSIIRDANGKDAYVAAVGHDITERQRSIDKFKQAIGEFNRLSNAMEQTASSVMITNRDGIIEYVNAGFENLTGFKRAEIIGKTPRALKSGKHDQGFYQALWKKLLSGEAFRGVFINSKKNGELFYQEETITPIKDETGAIVRFVSTGVDVSEMKRMEEALQEANEKLIVWVDELEQRGSEIFLLSEMADLLQTCLSPEEAYVVIGESLKKLFPNDSGAVCILKDSKNGLDIVTSWGDAASSRKAFGPNDCWAMRRGRLHVVEDVRSGLVCKHLSEPLPRAYMCIPMMAQSESLGILYLQNNPGDLEQPQEVRKLIVESKQRLAVTVAEHIALALANIRLRDTLRNQAIRDPLTGLFNRRYMEETLEREMSQARREKSTIGIIMLDIDFFKRFNDNFGHAAGDAMLRELGAFLKNSVRTGDIACRYGGEEFTLILPGANLEETANRARFIQQGIKNVNITISAQVTRTITLSLGVACFPEHGNDLDEVLRSADTALYRAKAEGRDRVVPYGPGMKEEK